jgi:hypothetical protein
LLTWQFSLSVLATTTEAAVVTAAVGMVVEATVVEVTVTGEEEVMVVDTAPLVLVPALDRVTA